MAELGLTWPELAKVIGINVRRLHFISVSEVIEEATLLRIGVGLGWGPDGWRQAQQKGHKVPTAATVNARVQRASERLAKKVLDGKKNQR